MKITTIPSDTKNVVKVKVKFSHYRPEQALGDPAS
jgi:hypothetical protein